MFLFGCIGGKKNGMYKRLIPMGIAYTLQETAYMFFWGVRTVIPNEMYNEAMDYCEWKNGYRTEAMTSAAKGLGSKLSRVFSHFISTMFKKFIGYDINKYASGRKQSDNTQFWLFAMATVLPMITSSFGIIPLLFYDLSGKKRDKMYEELMARRAAMSSAAADGDADAMEALKKQQKSIGSEK